MIDKSQDKAGTRNQKRKRKNTKHLIVPPKSSQIHEQVSKREGKVE